MKNSRLLEKLAEGNQRENLKEQEQQMTRERVRKKKE